MASPLTSGTFCGRSVEQRCSNRDIRRIPKTRGACPEELAQRASRRAVVSIGTNSTRLLLADISRRKPHVILSRSEGTRIGEGLHDAGLISEQAMSRTLEVVRKYARTVSGKCDDCYAIATSALRRGTNADEFERKVAAMFGKPLQVLSGEQEARASFVGATALVGANVGEAVGVLDVGGGSTEYATGHGLDAERVASYEIGAVRLTETFGELAGSSGSVRPATVSAARDAVKRGLAGLTDFPPVARSIVVGGSATTAVSIIRGHRRRFVTAPLPIDELRRIFRVLCELPLHRRKAWPGMNPQRADILPAGILILEMALEMLGRDRALASSGDLLLGYLLQTRISRE